MERLNNFRLFGRKISVTLARYKTRHSFWRKKGNGQPYSGAAIPDKITYPDSRPEPGKSEEDNEERGASSGKLGIKGVRICGHIESEDLWKLKKCLIGEMASVCTVESIHRRLEAWGMGDIKIKRFGGKSFLLSIEDLELFQMLEDVNCSYLREIFIDIQPWSESLKAAKRATWLEIMGVPLHCWNGTTFKRLIENLGEFIAFGENLNCCLDCEKMRVLVTTDLPQRINESVVLEVGNLFFNVQIWEVGFSDNSFIPKDTDKRKECDYKPTSSSSSSSEANNNSRRYSIENIREVEEAINEENIGSLNVGDREVEVSKEFSSGKRVLIETNQIEKEGEKSKQQKQSWISVLLRNPGKEGGLETGSIKKDLEVENTDVDFVVNNQAQEVDKTCGFEKLEKTVSGTHKHEDSKGIQFERAFEDASNMGLASSPKKTNEKKGVESFSEPVCPERLSTKGGSENLAIEQDEWSGSSDGDSRELQCGKAQRGTIWKFKDGYRKLVNRIDELEEVGQEGHAGLNVDDEPKDCKMKLWDTLKLQEDLWRQQG
ncbi:hypothetical protein V6N13_113048 [Hibiscus sabdariffa]